MSLKIKCNINHMKLQHETMHWEMWFQLLFHSLLAYVATLETSTWNLPLKLALSTAFVFPLPFCQQDFACWGDSFLGEVIEDLSNVMMNWVKYGFGSGGIGGAAVSLSTKKTTSLCTQHLIYREIVGSEQSFNVFSTIFYWTWCNKEGP